MGDKQNKNSSDLTTTQDDVFAFPLSFAYLRDMWVLHKEPGMSKSMRVEKSESLMHSLKDMQTHFFPLSYHKEVARSFQAAIRKDGNYAFVQDKWVKVT